MRFNPIILLVRFLKHFIHPFLGKRNQYNKEIYPILYIINILLWLFLIPIKVLEIFGLSYLLFKLLTTTRGLTAYEQQQLKLVFGDVLNLSKIRIKENSFWLKMTKQKGMAYVWMYTICISRSMYCESNEKDMAWLVHEVVHISQFNKLGFQYVFEALIAQLIGGYYYYYYYYYGGTENLKNNRLNYFNLEQQADMARDYYLDLKRNNRLDKYNNVISDLKLSKF